MHGTTARTSHIRRLLAVAVAGASLGVTSAFAVAAAQPDAAPTSCGVTSADLLRAADAARRLEAEHPEVFEESPRPAGYEDLRLAAEWARRVEALRPERSC